MPKARILIADDHDDQREALREALASEFDVVAAVATGDALLASALSLRPDVVVTDIELPGPDGLIAAERIMREVPNVRVVFVTIVSTPAVVDAVIAVGASGFVAKDLAGLHLVPAVRAALRGDRYVAISPIVEP